MYRAFDVLNLGASLWNILQTRQVHEHEIEHDNDLHVRGLAASAEHHYQQLIAELLAAAKEADRDVWEQRNGQFNNLMLASILMFGVSMSAIIEGNFDTTESPLCILLFSTFEALALSTLFLSLVCCLLVSRRMSVYMITRTGKLVERLSFIIKSADMLAADASGISSLPSPVTYKPRRRAGASAAPHISVTAREVAQERWKTVLHAISERRIPLHTSGFEVESISDGANGTLTHSEVAARRLTSMRSAQVSLQRELIRALESTSAGQRAVAAGAGVRRQVDPPELQLPLDSYAAREEDTRPLLAHRCTATCSSSSWSERAGQTDFRRQGSNPSIGAGPASRPPRVSEAVSSGWCEQTREAHPGTAGQGGAGGARCGGARGGVAANSSGPPAAGDSSNHHGRSTYRGLAGARADRAEAAERAREEDSRSEHVAAVQAALKLSGRIQTFDEFWKRHCRWISNLAFSSFYVGSGCVWGAVIVFFWGMFDDILETAAGVFVGICSCALVGSLLLVVHTLREDVGVRIETRLGYTNEGTVTPETGFAKH